MTNLSHTRQIWTKIFTNNAFNLFLCEHIKILWCHFRSRVVWAYLLSTKNRDTTTCPSWTCDKWSLSRRPIDMRSQRSWSCSFVAAFAREEDTLHVSGGWFFWGEKKPPVQKKRNLRAPQNERVGWREPKKLSLISEYIFMNTKPCFDIKNQQFVGCLNLTSFLGRTPGRVLDQN